MPVDGYPDPEVVVTFISIGAHSATASADGSLVLIDFVSFEDYSKSLRLCVPASQLQNFVDALRTVQKALADPTSGIHLQQPH